jgi:hypothetical protein
MMKKVIYNLGIIGIINKNKKNWRLFFLEGKKKGKEEKCF